MKSLRRGRPLQTRPRPVYFSSSSSFWFLSIPFSSSLLSKMQAIARPLARAAPRHVRYAGSLSVWSAVPAGPPDPILGTCRSSRFVLREAAARSALSSCLRLPLRENTEVLQLGPRLRAHSFAVIACASRDPERSSDGSISLYQVSPRHSRPTRTPARSILVSVRTATRTASLTS